MILSPGFNAVPNQVGLSVLRGGLAPMFNVRDPHFSPINCITDSLKKIVQHRSDCADKIFQTFKDIQDIIGMAEDQSQIFPVGKQLQQLVNALYNTLVGVMLTYPRYLEARGPSKLLCLVVDCQTHSS
jgi:hypothetical protein